MVLKLRQRKLNSAHLPNTCWFWHHQRFYMFIDIVIYVGPGSLHREWRLITKKASRKYPTNNGLNGTCCSASSSLMFYEQSRTTTHNVIDLIDLCNGLGCQGRCDTRLNLWIFWSSNHRAHSGRWMSFFPLTTCGLGRWIRI